MKENIVLPLGGGITGAYTYSTIGGMGIVGGFGGIGIGMTGMTAAGTILGSAIYGAIQGIENQDSTAFTTIGLGLVCGAGFSTVVGGIGISFGGSALGIGLGSMTAIGGIFGLGIYGLAKMFGSSNNFEPIAATFNRMEERITYEEAYYQALIELSPTLADLSWRQKFNELEAAEELEMLKEQIKAKSKLNLIWNNYTNHYDFIYREFEDYDLNAESEVLAIELPENFAWQPVKTLKGHIGEIKALAIKNNLLASASSDCTLTLWNLATGQAIFSFFEPSEVTTVAINNKIVIGGNQTRKITSWCLQNKTLARTFLSNSPNPFSRISYNHDSHDGLINALVLSSDGQTLFSAGADRTIKIWNTVTGQSQSILKDHTDSVMTLAITSCDRFLISGSADKTIGIWDLNNLNLLPQVLIAHDNIVTTLAVTNNGKYLVSGSADSTIKLWDLATKKLIYTIAADRGSIWSVAISSENQTIASASLDNKVQIWDLATGNLLQTIQASSPVIFSEDGSYLITGNKKNQIEIWQKLTKSDRFIDCGEMPQQWWLVLGVKTNASLTEIREAYHNLARQYHPDLNTSQQAQAIMQIINQAYQEAQLLFC